MMKVVIEAITRMMAPTRRACAIPDTNALLAVETITCDNGKLLTVMAAICAPWTLPPMTVRSGGGKGEGHLAAVMVLK
jgi:hypothetical protein